ncbi:hypothetical protein L1049_016740 [Liquidambar formosana]|uniref:Uncharacterized protein n=1 Tax=Liquidambar formosana TaxID=63359 RepID=A0AAP0S6W8_LIQFO
MIEGGEYGDSLNFFGVYKIGSTMSRLSVTSGTGSLRILVGSLRIGEFKDNVAYRIEEVR